jgi:hypothetical protein
MQSGVKTAFYCPLKTLKHLRKPYALAEDASSVFIFGDDLEAILDVLEEDEAVQEEFSAAVSNVHVSVENWSLTRIVDRTS